MFRVFFLFHRKLLSQLSRCAWKSICQYLEVSLSEKLQPAGIFSIATTGNFLNWNPHTHALIPSGAFRADGSFVPVTLFQENVLRQLFETAVFKLLVAEGLITAELITKMRTWKHSEWIAKVTLHIPEQGAQTVRYYASS